MRPIDAFRMAAGGLRERKMRTALTILGIVIGSSMIVALFASTQGQSAAIEEQLGRLGPTTLIVRSTGQTRLDTADLEKLLADERVETAFLSINGNVQATRAGIAGSATVIGLDAEDIRTLVKGIQVLEGEVFTSDQLTAAFIGYTVGAPDPDNNTYVYAGDFITVSTTSGQQGRAAQTTSRSLQVTGIAAQFGSAPFIDVDNTIFVPVSTAQQLMRLNPGQYNQIILIAADATYVDALSGEVSTILEKNVIVLSGTQLASTITGVYDTIGSLLTSVAAISLIVAGVGIANTMFVSVLERVTEIGTLKALGFKAREILSVFMLEAGLTGLIGGVVGCIAGVGLAFAIGGFITSSTASSSSPIPGGAAGRGGTGAFPGGGAGGGGFPGGGAPTGGGFGGGGNPVGGAQSLAVDADPVFTPELFLIAIGFAVVIALVAGLIPSHKAAKLDPVVALKRL